MKTGTTNIHFTNLSRRAAILLGTIAALLTAVACTEKPKPSVVAEKPVSAMVRPAALNTSTPEIAKPVSMEAANDTSASAKPALKPITFKSRDYGVTFTYPWQYAFLNAKTLANGSASLLPKPDGSDGQVTFARVEIPKGFYADSDLKSAYFMLTLNQDIGEQDCAASIHPDKKGEIQNEAINGVNFRWSESETGGHGSASKVRNYSTFANDTCYEVETGVITESDGLVKEVNPDQVMRRLSAILKTVEIKTSTESASAPQLKSSADPKPLDPKN